MGKIKHDDSENEMDVEGDNNRMHQEQYNQVVKKNKKIAKNKTISNTKDKASTALKASSDIVKHYAKLVNSKKKQRTLEEKQSIFKQVFKGLHTKNVSKKQRQKSRILMKKELRKALIKQEKPEPKASFSTMESQKPISQKKKKQPLNEKVEVMKFRNAMGLNISSLKNLLAQKLN